MSGKKTLKRNTIYLPQFTIGEEAFDAFSGEMGAYGDKAAVIYGEKAWAASKDYILPAFQQAGIRLAGSMLYGHDATYENMERIAGNPEIRNADFLLAVGNVLIR